MPKVLHWSELIHNIDIDDKADTISFCEVYTCLNAYECRSKFHLPDPIWKGSPFIRRFSVCSLEWSAFTACIVYFCCSKINTENLIGVHFFLICHPACKRSKNLMTTELKYLSFFIALADEISN